MTHWTTTLGCEGFFVYIKPDLRGCASRKVTLRSLGFWVVSYRSLFPITELGLRLKTEQDS